MDNTDISYDTLHTIFITPNKMNKDTIAVVIQWNQTLDPAFSMVRNQVAKFFDNNPNNATQACTDVLALLKILSETKCPKNFMRAYLANVKVIRTGKDTPAKLKLFQKLQYYTQKWQQAPMEVLEPYFDAFGLKQSVPKQKYIFLRLRINQFIDELIENKKYNSCVDFIKFLGVNNNKDNIDKLVGKMSTKRDASKAADYVKNLKLDPKDYPALGQRLYKNTARHFLTKNGWEYAQEIFQQNPEALACVIEDLIFKNKISQAKSIWSRHKVQEYLQKEQSIEFFKNLQKGEQQILPNYLYIDKFGPSNEQKYSCLQDFGIEEQDVIWVDKDTKNLQQILKDIENAQFLGIDTQSIVGQTKFEKTDEAAIIQISTLKKIYIFDGFNSNSQIIANTIEKCFNNQLIVGHSFSNDTQGILKAVGIKNKDLAIKNLIDICKVYKCLKINTRYSSLAHICHQVIGKQLSKQQTLTNWKRRPLRKNQIHYAALDAQIVLEIYTRWSKQYGQMLHYYADLDADSL